MKTFIITGASNGLGAALAKLCLDRGFRCILVARTINQELYHKTTQTSGRLTFVSADLTETNQLESVMDEIISHLKNDVDELYFINNAGMVEPIKRIGELDIDTFVLQAKLNYLAPAILTDSFIKRTQGYNNKKIVVNISSGAAKNHYEGWGAYCSSKAGLEMFTRVAGIEQQREENPAYVISFSPGVMDTNMQKVIRSANETDFADSARFHTYKEKGMLRSPEFVANILIELLLEPELDNGKFYDIKELIK
ncbi:(S)-benzoin forming benzil reductase [Peribacillus huizhouensis]|uniref:Benzil reductase ((S)-benzoin forming) n=1 Tax=Peribacillus huizhouensis TaxID=1501239 RepID=A0ABR6CPY2_9BACI|nr:(S)-benzoin forming benzil reductase [Peribacillus huizhouensis]MBA9027020.1 benzil reductase ((S)-benzoin forming) [Peribacillus huizhouensis]